MLGKSPLVFFSRLSAFTPVLLLIFKDTILGFLAGIQLTINKNWDKPFRAYLQRAFYELVGSSTKGKDAAGLEADISAEAEGLDAP